jgi:hypothetical protein
MAVGIDPAQTYQRGTYDLAPGDVVLAYTDGATDVTNFEGKKFGKKRLREAVQGLLAREPARRGPLVAPSSELRSWRDSERPDDQTVVVVRGGRLPAQMAKAPNSKCQTRGGAPWGDWSSAVQRVEKLAMVAGCAETGRQRRFPRVSISSSAGGSVGPTMRADEVQRSFAKCIGIAIKDSTRPLLITAHSPPEVDPRNAALLRRKP